MQPATLKASQIEAMTFVFTASSPATAGGRSPWTRLVRWARQKRSQHRRGESVAMGAVDWSFPGL